MKALFTEEERQALREGGASEAGPHPYIEMAADEITENGLRSIVKLIKGVKHGSPPPLMGVSQMAAVKREMKAAIQGILSKHKVFTVGLGSK